jgi:hypothetical protein
VAVAAPTAGAKTGGAATGTWSGTTTGGTPVTGTFTVNKFEVVKGVLNAVGTYTIDQAVGQTGSFTAPVTAINDTSLAGGASPAAAAAAAGSCQILDLTLGPLHLDLLGLVVDLNQVQLHITAEQGPGNLLGNLLCAVAGLLDNNTGAGGLSGILQSLANLLNQIVAQL